MAANNDDLDNFFKKKDRKNKPKKPTGLLTNNEELLKQLVIVTSATSAFKDNIDLDEDDDEHAFNDDATVGTGLTEDTTHKHPKTNHEVRLTTSSASKTDGQPLQQPQQQDEWEEFDDSGSKYAELRLKIRGNNPGENNGDDEDYYDDEGNLHGDEHPNELGGDREQHKDKPVWKNTQIQEQQAAQATEPTPTEEKPAEPKPATTGAYRPPQMRERAAIHVLGSTSINQARAPKKKEPNLASTEEFPTLGAAVNKK